MTVDWQVDLPDADLRRIAAALLAVLATLPRGGGGGGGGGGTLSSSPSYVGGGVGPRHAIFTREVLNVLMTKPICLCGPVGRLIHEKAAFRICQGFRVFRVLSGAATLEKSG